MIIIINGSPRVDGNSDFLSKRLADFCKDLQIDSRIIALRDHDIKYCSGCDFCHRNANTCSISDGFISRIMPALLDSRGLFLVSPVYQGGVTALMKTFMDRCEVFRKNRLLKGKFCGGAAIGGYPGGGQELTLMQMQYFSHICALTYIPSFGNVRSHLGGHCIAYHKGELEKDVDGIIACQNAISEMATHLKRLTNSQG